MSISVSSSGSMSPRDQFSFDKKFKFSAEKLTLGTGASVTGTGFPNGASAEINAPYNNTTSTGDIGYAILEVYHMLMTRGQDASGGIDWSKTVTFGFRAVRKVGVSADANSESRVFLGKSYATSYANSQEPIGAEKCVGFKIVGTSALQFICANGTTVSTVTTNFIPTKDVAFDVIIESSNGTAKLYVNDVLIATNTTAPTTQQGIQSMALWVASENKTAISTPNKAWSIVISDYFLTVL